MNKLLFTSLSSIIFTTGCQSPKEVSSSDRLKLFIPRTAYVQKETYIGDKPGPKIRMRATDAVPKYVDELCYNDYTGLMHYTFKSEAEGIRELRKLAVDPNVPKREAYLFNPENESWTEIGFSGVRGADFNGTRTYSYVLIDETYLRQAATYNNRLVLFQIQPSCAPQLVNGKVRMKDLRDSMPNPYDLGFFAAWDKKLHRENPDINFTCKLVTRYGVATIVGNTEGIRSVFGPNYDDFERQLNRRLPSKLENVNTQLSADEQIKEIYSKIFPAWTRNCMVTLEFFEE